MQRTILLTFLVATPFCGTAGGQEKEKQPQLTVATRRYGGSDLITLDAKGENVARLTQDVGDVSEPAWHREGGRLAYVATANGSGSLKILDVNSGRLAPVGGGANDRGPAWSPDGKQLLFTSSRDGNAELYVMDADGSNAVNLTRHPSYDADAAWSPDGKKIAFTSNRTGAFRLYVMNRDGTELVELLKEDLIYCVYPCWSPDGQQIAFGGRGGDGTIQLCVVNADGQGLQQLSQGAQMNSYAAWSPDGQYIAYARFETMQVGDNSIGKGDLMLYDLIEDKHTKLLADELPIVGPRPAWKPAVEKQ